MAFTGILVELDIKYCGATQNRDVVPLPDKMVLSGLALSRLRCHFRSLAPKFQSLGTRDEGSSCGSNVSRAAELLQLKKLEDQLALELFSRTANGLALSRDGAALLAAAERALAALADFSEAARRLNGTTRGQLRIGTVVDPEFIRLGAFLRELTSLAPELDPELRQGMSGTVAHWICKGELDVGFCLGSAREAALSATPQDTAQALP